MVKASRILLFFPRRAKEHQCGPMGMVGGSTVFSFQIRPGEVVFVPLLKQQKKPGPYLPFSLEAIQTVDTTPSSTPFFILGKFRCQSRWSSPSSWTPTPPPQNLCYPFLSGDRGIWKMSPLFLPFFLENGSCTYGVIFFFPLFPSAEEN